MTALTMIVLAHVAFVAPDEPPSGEAKLEAPSTVEPAPAERKTPAPVAPAPAEPTPKPSPTPAAPAVDLDVAVLSLLGHAIDPVRVAVLPVNDNDGDRARRVATGLARAVMDAGPSAVSAGRTQSLLTEEAIAAAASGEMANLEPLAADHVLISDVVELAGAVVVNLRLVHVQTGAVVGTARGRLVEKAKSSTTVSANTIRGGVATLADEIEQGMQNIPGESRYQRLAVLAFDADNAQVKESGVDRALQGELIDALKRRGFLVVERQQLSGALDQISAGQATADDSAPQYGALLDAQAVVLGSIAEAGDVYVVTARVVGTENAKVEGTASTTLRRNDAVSLASDAIETKSALDAMFRSAVAPGWGQFYNDEPVKGGVVGVFAYGGAATTVALAAASITAAIIYLSYVPDKGLTAEQQSAEVVTRRTVGSALLWVTGASAAVTAAVWSAGVADAFLTGQSLYGE